MKEFDDGYTLEEMLYEWYLPYTPWHILYAESKNGRRVTLAYYFDPVAKGIFVGKAECSHNDRFVKRIGRTIAINRLDQHIRHLVSLDTLEKYINSHNGKRKDYSDLIVKYLRENVDKF